MNFMTTTGRGYEIISVDYSVDADGEMYVNDITTPAGVEISGYISDEDFESIEVSAWADYEKVCQEAKADYAEARYEDRRLAA